MTELDKKIEKLVQRAHFYLRPDVKNKLEAAFKQEKQSKAKLALKWMLDNAEIAKKNKLPLCQDTGACLLFFEIGLGFERPAKAVEKIKKSLVKAFYNNCLRPSMVDPLLAKKPSHKGLVENYKFLPKQKGIKITILPKGFGSENKTQLRMFNPTAKIGEIEDFIVESVRLAGPEACPPFFVGIGVGGSSDYALCLAKKALLDRMDSFNRDKGLNLLEKRILGKINKLKLGPMGFGGKFTALGVRIRKHPTHIAGLPVGVNISCHALRSATLTLSQKEI